METYVVAKKDSELYHHGTKGMRWGVRRYQNKDGSLTPAGQKRYGDSDGVATPKKKVSRKVKKQREAALKKARDAKAAKKEAELKQKEAEKELADKREKLLKSSNADEIYRNRHLLTTAELNERMNRINMEQNLARMAESTKTTGMDKINKALTYARKADEVYQFATGSKVGKDLMKKLGFGESEKAFNLKEFYENIDKKSTQEILDAQKRVIAGKKLKEAYDDAVKKEKTDSDAEDAAKKQAKAQKEVDNYNKRWQKNGADDSVTSNNNPSDSGTTYNKKGDDLYNQGSESSRARAFIEGPVERWTGTVEGVGTSRSSMNDSTRSTRSKPDDYYDPIDMPVSNSSISNVPAVYTNTGRNYVAGLLEDRS